MNKSNVWIETVTIPTYPVDRPQKAPVFLEKRVYQGSSGRVYPYPVTEAISDEKTDRQYQAVFLENEYLKIMVLPELGGRIQRAFDKTNGYDFVYYNHVIKPALVGLTGPWISGGIEFNWPQHHRPTTFSPVDFTLERGEDGSASVLLHDVDQMYGTKGIAKITLYPGRAYIEIAGQLYNRTPMPQTFLWWANPAVPVNENTQSIFPPDVHAVMDHGKRDVSRFPIATGVYYKKDYSEGVDISRYKNIPVPTSYMAEKSKYDFVGGYDYGVGAGLLHVADHHISPGKKQWTWGCGDFGKAWDRNLTDSDGPYVELMTGVFTDNQPDFTWLKPFEEKVFRQYFMPYKVLGTVQNATKEAAVHLAYNGAAAEIRVYATGEYHAVVSLEAAGRLLLEESVTLSPTEVFQRDIPCPGAREEELRLSVYADGECLVEYQPEKPETPKLPEPAQAAKAPVEIMTNEELYLTGQHIEQYRHATYLPDPYYLEGLKRDPGDIRINNAYGLLLLRRARPELAQPYFEKALERLTQRNPNPYHSETYYLLGLCLLARGREDESYDAFYKAAWSAEQQEKSYYYLAAIDAGRGRLTRALEHIERSLVKNSHNIKARGLKAYLLRRLGRIQEAMAQVEDNLKLDPFDFVSGSEGQILNGAGSGELDALMRDFPENYLMAARDYAEWGAYEEAVSVLDRCKASWPLLAYYKAFYTHKQGVEDVRGLLDQAESAAPDCCFPNKPEDMAVLRFAIEHGCKRKAPYYLGCLFYDKLQWEEAVELWEMSAEADPEFPTVHRNLALAYYNKCGRPEKALEELETAFALDPSDPRVFLELDQLHKKLGWTFKKRLEDHQAHAELLKSRDDLYIEYITLLNLTGRHEEACRCIMGHKFHPWEGGEGKITTQYVLSLLSLARGELEVRNWAKAEELLRKAFVYPENLGEGKLEGTKDNHLYYHLGLALEGQGRADEARECFELATLGTDEPAGALYYNDQPADMILYQGLSYLKLGDTPKARSRFYRLLDYGERHLNDEVGIPYFAVSLPEFLIFDEDYTRRNRAHCCYLMALGNLGLGEAERAREFLNKAAAIEPPHMMCHVYKELWRGVLGA